MRIPWLTAYRERQGEEWAQRQRASAALSRLSDVRLDAFIRRHEAERMNDEMLLADEPRYYDDGSGPDSEFTWVGWLLVSTPLIRRLEREYDALSAAAGTGWP